MAEGKKPFYKRWWFWVLIVILLIAIFSGGNNDNNVADNQNTGEENATQEDNNNKNQAQEEDSNEDENNAEEEQPAEEPEDTGDRIEPGIYEVGTELEPGLYKTDGDISYWARLSGFGGSLDEIIANGTPQGQAYVNIDEGDAGFETTGSGYWYKIEDDYAPEMTTSFGDGIYIVGKDIAPGRYKSNGGGYWARLSGFSGELDDIIANDNPQGSTIVEITASDAGFETYGNGTWTKMD